MNVKTKILSIFLAIILLLSNCVFLQFIFSKKVFADQDLTEVSITNASFNDDIVSGSVVSPTGWSKVNESRNVTNGIISLNQEIFEKQMADSYKLSFKPYSYQSMSDEQILMLNAKNEKQNMGYQSEVITLNKNSYYKISFKALTENNGANVIASANLTNADALTSTPISIVTSGNWKEYSMLVETSKIANLDTNLQLWLGFNNGVGSYGAVFFDDVKAYELSENAYNTMLNANRTNSAYAFYNLNQSLYTQFDNNGFENSLLTGWKTLQNESDIANENNYAGIVNFNSNDYKNIYKLSEKPTDANIYNNNQALLINNNQASAIGFKSTSTITIKQHHFYKISILAKTNISTGTASAILTENNPYSGIYDDFAVKTFTREINTTSSTNAKTNDWIEYSFYIQGRSFEDTTVNLELWIGKDEKAVGYAMFDNILVYEINYNDYTTGISQSNATDANFASKTDLTIANGKFNLVESAPSDSYPYTPQEWTNKSTEANPTQSGVINTLDTSMLPNITNPTSGNIYSNNNNILMIGNLGSNAQTYTTKNNFTLKANSYYKLSFKVQTQNLGNGATAGFKLYSDTLTLKEMMYIESNDTWTTYKLLIKTGQNDYTCNIELSLGSKHNGTGYAFFDDVVLTNSTEANYNQSLSSNSLRVNLASDDFTNTSDKRVDGLYESNSLTSNNASATFGAVSGIVDVTKTDAMTGSLTGVQNPLLPQGVSGNVAVIKSGEDANYTLTTKESFKLSTDESKKYYKISVWVLTQNLSQQDSNKNKIEGTDDYYPYGATIMLTSINKTFSGINTNGEWKEYIYYINTTDEATIQIVLGLGSSNALTAGIVFFSNLQVETITQTAYYEGVAPLEDDDTITNIMAVGSTKIENPDNTDTDNSGSNFNWLVIPTLITSIALLIAIIGIAIRNFARKHPRKAKLGKLAYNREITLAKDFDKLEEYKRNQQLIKELEAQLVQVKLDIEQAKQEYKQDEKAHKEQLEKEINAQRSTKSRSEIKAYATEKKLQFKLDRLARYKQRQAELEAKYRAIQLEIEAIYQEELRLIKLYKEYKKQVKAKKKELKAKNHK